MTAGAMTAARRSRNGAADGIRDLRGWRRFAVAFVAGLLSALAFAPFGIFPFLLFSFAVLILLLDGAQTGPNPIWRSAVSGWAYGFGQFLAGLYWVAYAFLVDPLAHAWQIPFVLLLFPGGLALFPALACAVSSVFWRPGLSRIFVFAAAYAIAEWLRGHVLTGFPWNIPGYGWGASLAVLQSAAVFGVYGLSFFTVLFGASLALLSGTRRQWLIPSALAALFIAFWIGGAVRLSTTAIPSVPGVRLRIVQPNVPQAEKYAPELRVAHWRELIRLSAASKGPPPTHIVWPEAAPPFLLAREPQALAGIAALTGNNKVLMTGAVRVDPGPGGKPVAHNSFYIFGHRGRLLAIYDKFHLVPFGEYVPFPATLHALGIDKLVDQPGSFASGDGPHTFDVPGAPPVGPLICYEILFSGQVVAARRPSWLVNVTDDSWFGPPSSTGPYQHFLVARVRAIEEGLPVVRAANTGISAVIDPLGRIVARLGIDKTGILDANLPKAIAPPPFVLIRYWGFWILVLLCVIAAAVTRAGRLA